MGDRGERPPCTLSLGPRTFRCPWERDGTHAGNGGSRCGTTISQLSQGTLPGRLSTGPKRGRRRLEKASYSTERCQFTKDIDKALPQRHTRILYDDRTREDAAILAQLRTNKCRLNGYLSKIKASPTELCECGQPETVRHFLIECPRWDNQRQALKQAVGTRCADLSYLLGGWSDTKNPDGTYVDGPKEKWKLDRKVVLATIAFAKSTRRLEMGKGAERGQR